MDKSSLKQCLRTDDGHAPQSVRDYCQKNLNQIEGISVTTADKPPDKKRCLTTLYEQQSDGLKTMPDGPVFSVENDVLYHPSRFDFELHDPDTFWYQTNFFNLTEHGYLRHDTGRCYSQMVATNALWKSNLTTRIDALKNGWHLTWAEPGHGDPPGGTNKIAAYYADYPDVGIRHGRNYTGDRKSNDPDLYIDQIPYWGDYRELWAKLKMPTQETVKKLNIGSGCMLLEGYVNFDTVKVVRGDKHTDVIGDARNILDFFEPESFDEIMCCHVLEHFRPKDGKKLIQDCHKLLRSGGTLVVECPDVLKMIQMWNEKNATFGDPPSIRKLLTFFYGWDKDQWRDYGFHQYGYTEDTASELLTTCGYEIIKKCEGRMHGRRARDFRVEGRRI